MLSQLVYVSNRKPNCSSEEIEKILASCEKNNPSLNITGVLLYSETKFIQLVEGEAKVIMDLYEKIKKDDRHSNTMMISYNAIKEKSFPSWHMGTRNISSTNVHFKTDISADDKVVFNSILNGKEENGQKVLNLLRKFF
jgi:hypothetical protein